MHSEGDPANNGKPIATYHKRINKRLSAEAESTFIDHSTVEVDQLQFDVVQRDKWDLSQDVKLFNQTQMSPTDSPTRDKLLPCATLNSLDLAGTTLNEAGKSKSSDVEGSRHIRSKSDLIDSIDKKPSQVEAVGIVLNKGYVHAAIDSPSFNIGEVEDDDEIQPVSNSIDKPAATKGLKLFLKF